MVDAAYSYWDAPSGPSEANVCGAVTITPYYESSDRSGETHHSATESTINCDHSETPWAQYAAAFGSANGHYSDRNGACSLGDSGACDTVRQYLRCFNSGVNLAAEQSPFPITVSGVATNVVSGASSFAETSESPVVSSLRQAGHFGVGMLGAVNTIGQVRSAYNSCFS
ncbi:MAG: hypothetical protein QOI89_2276 [Solirubrobacteraceae bacterium]|nr:hypothetical protein [Solirubrobacteraceae bacterium]